MTDFSNTFQEVISNIEQHGDISKPRDLEVKELLLAHLSIDPRRPIADFKSRAFNWKYFAGEMAWYLHRDTDVDYIGQYSGMWSTLTNPGTNEINSNYGALVINDEQIGWVVDSLLADKNSRQAIMFFNQPKFQFKGNKDFVCTMYGNFFIRNNKLNMKIQMRSNDIFYGLTFDAPFFSFLMQTVYLILKKNDQYKDLELGTYHHYADNIHFYERHFELANKIEYCLHSDDMYLILNLYIDNIHFYERHFELANKIEDLDLTEAEETYLILKKPLVDYTKKDGVFLTDEGIEFTRRMDQTQGAKGINYKNILKDYFTI
jgi:thymidylate synthase